MAKDTKDRVLATALDMFSGNTAQSAFGASWKIHALISSLFLEIHKVFLQKMPSSEPKFSQDSLSPNYAVLP